MIDDQDSLKDKFSLSKKIIDLAYNSTKDKYGEGNAKIAIREYLLFGKVDRITRNNNARKYAYQLSNYYYEFLHVLMEYAMSSYIYNHIDKVVSSDDLYKYVNEPDNKDLKYDTETIISLVAIASDIWNSEWLSLLFIYNKRVKDVLVKSFIQERYIDNKKEELDNSSRSRFIKVPPQGKRVVISIDQLDRNTASSIKGDEMGWLIDTIGKDSNSLIVNSNKKG